MSEPFTTTRQAYPCAGGLPGLSSRFTGDGIRFELCCKCGTNVYSRHEIDPATMDAYRTVDLLTKDWNEQMGEPFSTVCGGKQ
jgi:hypothetical protein